MNNEIIKLMRSGGADLVGFADLDGIGEMPYGVVVAIAMPKEIFLSAEKLPNPEYLSVYNNVNETLNSLVTTGADYLISKGYKAKALTTEVVAATEHKRAELPAKTVATKAGIGWIGKNALLVTKRFGSALRISTFLTDAKLDCAQAITESECGKCTMCADNCPANAINGVNWLPSVDRDELVNVHSCSDAAKKMCKSAIGEEHQICGKCIAVCPYTRQYINSAFS